MLAALRGIVQAVNAAGNLQAALDIIVERIAEVMGTEVCTVYLRNPESGRLIFMANQGLNPDLIGKASLAADEGLVGQVARREEPLNLDHAEKHPNFLLLPGIGEEQYHSFLGAPIIHQREVLGVLVVQQKDSRRFDEEEEAFLVTMSAQLAGVLAHARATGSISKTQDSVTASALFKGIAGAPGVAIGRAVVIVPSAELHSVPQRRSEDADAELRAFEAALDAVRVDIRELSGKLVGQLSPEELALFDVYLRILDDGVWLSEVEAKIREGEWAQGALAQVVSGHINTFEMMDDPYFKDRATDIKDLGRRVLSYLQASNERDTDYPADTILVGEELTASMLGEVPREKLVGMVSVRGSSNSHVAILARAMGIPTVMGASDLPYTQIEHASLVVDGYSGYVHYNPTPEVSEHFRALLEEDQALSQGLEALRDLPSETRDGHRMPLWVNTGLMADVARSLDRGAEGVGLYRTEIPFLLRERFPSEEEQRIIYREQLLAFAPLPVTMRTLDIGGDKALPYFPIDEENPFLGWRGIRVTLDHPEIFLVQVRAMLKASSGLDNLRIMLPMISNVQEVDEALVLVRRAYDELVEDGWDISLPPIGVMVEVPAAVYQARQLARRVDFLSVGSNDLTQYLLAVDRNNTRVADLYHAYHPAVLGSLLNVVDAAHAEGKPVGICGELAGDPGAVLLLTAMGYDMLSMNDNSLLRVKAVVRASTMSDLKNLLTTAMAADTADEVRALLRSALAESGMEKLLPPGP
ncbi:MULTISPECIES: phosphoenolpyruvate--protein phosphotransferase [Spongiibacter]|jgi:phosphotransferase system enzyme I (PtsP)|uniref:phosphoenolpyruvate--protein phosphotransferase n=1 Tax=Spongiibacter TaxID=630749 RepID=UPI001960DAD7|nr:MULTISPECIES: phosphoenolpyruvate--protein phosphotransferase [Spongiibacter]MBM7421777.1 phosphotransferase system enzyme I (PtsP) [Spongiibacter marinus]|tara:strand:+ start:12302 stop:14563 length:2262 start_codon:yes stop_codon:yes gene_type:complete